MVRNVNKAQPFNKYLTALRLVTEVILMLLLAIIAAGITLAAVELPTTAAGLLAAPPAALLLTADFWLAVVVLEAVAAAVVDCFVMAVGLLVTFVIFSADAGLLFAPLVVTILFVPIKQR